MRTQPEELPQDLRNLLRELDFTHELPNPDMPVKRPGVWCYYRSTAFNCLMGFAVESVNPFFPDKATDWIKMMGGVGAGRASGTLYTRPQEVCIDLLGYLRALGVEVDKHLRLKRLQALIS